MYGQFRDRNLKLKAPPIELRSPAAQGRGWDGGYPPGLAKPQNPTPLRLGSTLPSRAAPPLGRRRALLNRTGVGLRVAATPCPTPKLLNPHRSGHVIALIGCRGVDIE